MPGTGSSRSSAASSTRCATWGCCPRAPTSSARRWSARLPLVDGHGNFGSPDDGPAAYRYTEARLAPAALEMTSSLDEDTVDFVDNYDGTQTQPEVLPA